MEYKTFIYYIFLLQIIKTILSLRIPFQNNINTSTITEENFINELSDVNITTNFLLGTPYQNISFYIKLQKYNLIVLSYKALNAKYINNFNQDNSSSFKSDDRIAINYGLLDTEFCRRSKDIFNIDSDFFFHFNFLLAYDNYNNQSGILGLKFRDSYQNYSFLYQLNKNKIIHSNIFYFKFSRYNFNDGEIIFGSLPHENEHLKYDLKYFYTTNLKPSKSYQQDYNIIIDKIFIGNTNIEQNQIFTFNFENYFLKVPFNYLKIFQEEYLKDLIEKEKCKKKLYYINRNSYYICDNDININKLKKIKFYSHDLDFTFILNPEDLFIKGKEKLFLLITFSESLSKEWSFGYNFLKKYTIVFDQDRKVIGFYKIIQNNTSNIYSLLWVITIIFGLIIIGLVNFIYVLKKNKKNKALELEEHFAYASSI